MNRSILLRLFLVSVVLLLSIFIANKKVFSENWVYFSTGAAHEIDYYYNKDNIMELSPSIKRVWIKKFQSANIFIEQRKKIGLSISDFSSYGYSLELFEIDCKKQLFSLLTSTEKSNDGTVLESSQYEDSKPHFIPPESIIKTLHKAICY